MNFWKVIIATIVIFGAGVFTGGMIFKSKSPQPEKVVVPSIQSPGETGETHARSNFPPNMSRQMRPPEIMGNRFTGELDNALKLTPEQSEAVKKVLADSQTQMNKAVQNVRQDAWQKIREQLTPEQQKKFDDLMKRPPRRPAFTNSPNGFGPGFPPPR